MKLVRMNCPNCNSPLKVSDDAKKVKCKYCDTDIYIDDESIEVKHVLYSGEKEEKLKNAEALLKLKEYDQAYIIYKELSMKYIYKASIWYSLIRCITEDFTNFYLDYFKNPIINYEECREYLEKYKKLENDDEEREKNVNKYLEYEAKLLKKSDEAIDEDNKERLITKTEVDEESSKEIGAYSKYIIIGFIIIILVIVVFNSFYDKDNNYKNIKELDNISIYSYYNNSKDYEYELKEVKSNGALCYHFVLHSDNKDKEYELLYKTSDTDQIKSINVKFKDESSGYICWNTNSDNKLEVKKYKIYLYVSDNGSNILLDTKEVNVVE